MAEWQKNELDGETDLQTLVAMTENNDGDKPTSQDLEDWKTELDLDCIMIKDSEKTVLDMYIEGNPDNDIEVAVTVLIGKDMVIREVFGEEEGPVTLESIQGLLAE